MSQALLPLPAIHLLPGEMICRRQPLLVTTLLGSCVAVALWDRRLRHGGIIHALLPQAPAGRPPSPRFVDTGVALLIDRMHSLGSTLGDIEAKLFGGADVLLHPSSGRTVGERNLAAAMARLEAYDMPVTAARIGGTAGIVVKFSTGTGTALVRRVEPQGAIGAGAPAQGGGGDAIRSGR